MSQILLTLADNTKIEAFLAFVKDLSYIEKAEVLPETTPTEQLPKPEDVLPTPSPAGEYTVEQIKGIASHFPKKYKWTAPDIAKYFPQDLKISVQIIQNQLFVMASPNDFHQALSLELSTAMHLFVKANKLGKLRIAPYDVEFDNDNVFQPDIVFVAVTRHDIMHSQGIVGAPDLVVEIWSPANKKKEREMKHELYERSGVTEYWQIFPKKKQITVEVLNQAGKYEKIGNVKNTGTVHSQVLQGFSIDIEELWKNCEA
jgi:Uma2 family endonuclease